MPGFANGTPHGTVRQLLNDTGLRKNNFAADRAPVAGDNASLGYEPGSRWLWGTSEWIYTGSEWVAPAPAGGGSVMWADIPDRPTISGYGLTLIDDADDATARATLGLGAASTWTNVPNDHVTNARLANMPAATLKGNHTAASADPGDLPAAQVKAMLGIGLDDVTGLQAALDDKLPAREQRKVLAADATVTGTTFVNAGLSFSIEANAAYHVFVLGRVASDTLTSGGTVMLVGPSDCTENGIAWTPNSNGANGQFMQQRFTQGAGGPVPSTGVATINNSYPLYGHWIVLAGASSGVVQVQMQAEEAGATFRLYANSWLIARKLEAT